MARGGITQRSVLSVRQILPKMRPQVLDRPGPKVRVAFGMETLFSSGFVGKPTDLPGLMEHHRAQRTVPMERNPAYPLFHGLLGLNRFAQVREDLTDQQRSFVEVHICSRAGQSGLRRLYSTIKHYGLERLMFPGALQVHLTNGNTFVPPMLANGGVDVFFSSDVPLVRELLERELVPAAHVPPYSDYFIYDKQLVRGALTLAFDWDSVVVDSENDEVTMERGLGRAVASEASRSHIAHGRGPFYSVLQRFMDLRSWFPERGDESPLRLALVTSRSIPNYERMDTTLDGLGGEFDRIEMTDGTPKGARLAAIHATMFIDDHIRHVAAAQANNVPVAHVPYGPHAGDDADGQTDVASQAIGPALRLVRQNGGTGHEATGTE